MTTSISPPAERRSARSMWVSVAVAVGTFVFAVVNLSVQANIDVADIPAGGFVLLAFGSVALYWWRSRPLAVFGVACVMTLAWFAFSYPGNPVFHILVSLYAVGRYVREWRTSLAALAVALAITVLALVADNDPISDIVTGVMVSTLPWYIGLRLRLRREAGAGAS